MKIKLVPVSDETLKVIEVMIDKLSERISKNPIINSDDFIIEARKINHNIFNAVCPFCKVSSNENSHKHECPNCFLNYGFNSVHRKFNEACSKRYFYIVHKGNLYSMKAFFMNTAYEVKKYGGVFVEIRGEES